MRNDEAGITPDHLLPVSADAPIQLTELGREALSWIGNGDTGDDDTSESGS